MPQLDPYILFHQIISLFVIFFLIYIYVRKNILPKVNEILKYRNKKLEQLYGHDRGNKSLYNQSRFYYTWMGNNYLNLINNKLGVFSIKYLEKQNTIHYKLLLLKKLEVLFHKNLSLKIYLGDNSYKTLKNKHSVYYLNN